MYTIHGTIQGVAPMLFNAFVNPEKIGTGTNVKKSEKDKLAEAQAKVYRDDAGLFWPAWNLKRALIEGCNKAGLKEGRAGMAKFIEATVFVEADPHFEQADYDRMHEVMGRIPPKTGAAALIRRPLLEAGWRLPFVMNVLDDRRRPEDIRRALEEAGLLVGIGSWRPEYGRFLVTEWTVSR